MSAGLVSQYFEIANLDESEMIIIMIISCIQHFSKTSLQSALQTLKQKICSAVPRWNKYNAGWGVLRSKGLFLWIKTFVCMDKTLHTCICNTFWCVFILGVCKPNFIHSSREVTMFLFYHFVTEQTVSVSGTTSPCREESLWRCDLC